MAGYESPVVVELGSIADFTQGQGLAGNADHFHFQWGPIEIDFDYGHS